MRTLALTAAALVAASAAGHAQSGHQRFIYEHTWDEGGAKRTPYAPPIDNRRPSFAAHVGANGQGVE